MSPVLADALHDAFVAMRALAHDRSLPAARHPAMSGETLLALFTFLSDVVDGAFDIDAEGVRREAATWRMVVAERWAPAHPATADVSAALDAIVALDLEEPDVPAPPDASPLQRAAGRASTDAGARPDMWRAIHDHGVWIAVLDVTPRDVGLELRMLTILRDGVPFVVAASSESRLTDLLPRHAHRARVVHVPGHHVATVWPRGHHLVLDPGEPHAAVLTPAEMLGLPSGPLLGLGDPTTLSLDAPDVDSWRVGRLEALVEHAEGLEAVTWARAPDGTDLLAFESGAAVATVACRLAASGPLFGFGDAVVLPADDGVLAGRVVEHGRRVGGDEAA